MQGKADPMAFDFAAEVLKRTLVNVPCKYYKIDQVRECCPGYAGVSCNQLIDQVVVDPPITHVMPYSVCALWGIDRFRTFNKQFFKFRGGCDYQLSAHTGSWQVILRTTGCDKFASCRKTLKMYFGNSLILASGENITVDGVELERGKGYLKGSIIIESQGDFYQLRFSDGVKIKWSVDSLQAFLTIEEQYRNKVSGLCGDYSLLHANDKVLRDMVSYATDSFTFGNSWKTDSSVSRLLLNVLKVGF